MYPTCLIRFWIRFWKVYLLEFYKNIQKSCSVDHSWMSCSALYWLKKTDEPDELDICGPILKWIFKLLVVSYDLRVGTYVESTGYELVLLEQRVVSYELKFETASYLREMRVKVLKLQLINKCLLLEKIMSYLKKCKLNSLKYCCP